MLLVQCGCDKRRLGGDVFLIFCLHNQTESETRVETGARKYRTAGAAL